MLVPRRWYKKISAWLYDLRPVRLAICPWRRQQFIANLRFFLKRRACHVDRAGWTTTSCLCYGIRQKRKSTANQLTEDRCINANKSMLNELAILIVVTWVTCCNTTIVIWFRVTRTLVNMSSWHPGYLMVAYPSRAQAGGTGTTHNPPYSGP